MRLPRRTHALVAAVVVIICAIVALATFTIVSFARERAEALRLVDATLEELEQVHAQADAAAAQAEIEREELLARIDLLTRQVEELQEQVRELGGTPVTPTASSDDDPVATETAAEPAGPDPPPPRRVERPQEPRAPELDPDPPPDPGPAPSPTPAPPPGDPDPTPPDEVCVLDLCIDLGPATTAGPSS